MKIGVLGTGDVGRTLGKAFITLGHEVKLGARAAGNEKARAWVKEMGERASEGSFADAAGFGEIIVLATLGVANEQAIRQAGVERFGGKLVIDTTNPLDFSKGGPALAVGHTDSAGEQVQRLLPAAKVVKAFNTVGHVLMFRPELPGGPPDMFIAGNDDAAKARLTKLLRDDFGWGVIDVGGIEASRNLEPMCLTWVAYGFRTNTWTHAFKLLHR